MEDKLQRLKEELYAEVFAKMPNESQKRQIINKIQRKQKKKSFLNNKWLYPVLAVAAIFIAVIMAYPMLKEQTPNSAKQTPKPNPNPDHHVILPDKEMPKEHKDEPKQEQKPPVKHEKTAEEWKQEFRQIWTSEREPFDKLLIKYNRDRLNYGEHYFHEMQVKSELRNGDIFARVEGYNKNVGNIKDPFGSIIKNDTLYDLNPHAETKTYEVIKLEGSAKDIFNSPEFSSPYPLFPSGADLTSERFKWTVDRYNEKEHWIKISAENTKPKEGQSEFADEARFTAEVDTTYGILMDLKMYDEQNQLIDNVNVTELKVNNEVRNLNLDLNIPAGYKNIEEAMKERVKINDNWVQSAKAKIQKNHPEVNDVTYYGEGGALVFAINFKDNTDLDKEKTIAQEFSDQFTINANASEEYKSRNNTVWGKGQYGLNVMISNSLIRCQGMGSGKEDASGTPLLKWEEPDKIISH
ncbi:hypothetical protein [Falsibacillus albus]|uniref:Uncharacterized protein n=1 Tax=Falsibacillus albus TaxID=2478915 RepID=A0A3L7JWU4_9BACI|nr:hypothetical protein [Falsibacillus albus]RLQ94795.1 hypothetical protein D9X91_12430 [Falsibacillus albus]